MDLEIEDVPARTVRQANHFMHAIATYAMVPAKTVKLWVKKSGKVLYYGGRRQPDIFLRYPNIMPNVTEVEIVDLDWDEDDER